MKRILPALAAAAVSAALTAVLMRTVFLPPQPEPEPEPAPKAAFGVFSWNDEIPLTEEGRQALALCAGRAGVTALYQQFSDEMLESGGAGDFVRDMGQAGVAVYALMGEAEWAYDSGGESLVSEIEKVAEYNRRAGPEEHIAGVVADVEPYLLDEWDGDGRDELMDGYLAGMSCAFQYASRSGLAFWPCIPTFYDASAPEVLERLIETACDGVAVMNYNRSDEYGQIAREVGYAREYGKGVVCIYELQPAGRHDLEEINTYAGQGLEALWQSAGRLEKQFGYERLSFAYHYLDPLVSMLEDSGQSYDGLPGRQ